VSPAGPRDGVLQIRIARCPGAHDLPLPRRATPGAAGLDLCAALERDLELLPGERALVPTGVRLAVPPGFEAQVRPRSGLAWHHGVVLPNAPGTIDSDYRGEVKVVLLNAGREPFRVRRGDRIAQLVVAPVARVEWSEVAALPPSRRGAAGWGSSGGVWEPAREGEEPSS
jgi:dUTP pyrophosphatase